MGTILSNSWKSDKKSRSQIMDDSVWFSAKIVDFSVKALEISIQENSDNSNRKPKRKSSNNELRYSGRISIKDECLVFQSLNPLNSLLVNPNCYDRFVNNGYNNMNSPTNNNVFTFASAVTPNTTVSSSSSTQQNSPSQLSTSSSGTSTGNYHHKKWSGLHKSNSINDPIAQYHTIVWPLCTVRNFAFYANIFSFDTGRMSPTGESRFTFKIHKFNAFYRKFAVTQYSVDRINSFSSINKSHQRSRTLKPGKNELLRIPRSSTLSPVNSPPINRKLHHNQKAQSVKNLYELNNGSHQEFACPCRSSSTKNSDFDKSNKVQLRRGSRSIGDFEYRYQNIHNTMTDKSTYSPKHVLTNQNSDDSYQSPIEYINVSAIDQSNFNSANETNNYYNNIDDTSSSNSNYLSPIHNYTNSSPNYAQICVNSSPSSSSTLPSTLPRSTQGNYLVICENHTRAVEQVMKLIK